MAEKFLEQLGRCQVHQIESEKSVEYFTSERSWRQCLPATKKILSAFALHVQKSTAKVWFFSENSGGLALFCKVYGEKSYPWQDDDSYVDIQNLVEFLHRLDPNKPALIGSVKGFWNSNLYSTKCAESSSSAGYGKDSDDYVELGMNYCMGGTGMIFTRRLLFDLGPHLKNCVKNLVSGHEDIEIGRCVWKKTGNMCTSSTETQDLFYNNFDQNRSHIGSLSNHVLDVGIIYHPNKKPAYQVGPTPLFELTFRLTLTWENSEQGLVVYVSG